MEEKIDVMVLTMSEETEKEIIQSKTLVEKMLREHPETRDMSTQNFTFFVWKFQDEHNNGSPLLKAETVGRSRRMIQNTEKRYRPNQETAAHRNADQETHKNAWASNNNTANTNKLNNFDSNEDERIPQKPFLKVPIMAGFGGPPPSKNLTKIFKIKDLHEKHTNVRIQGWILNRNYKADWNREYLQITDMPTSEKIKPRISLTILESNQKYFGKFKKDQKIDISDARLVKNKNYFNLHLTDDTTIKLIE